jgi:electron transport complex protein RnfD
VFHKLGIGVFSYAGQIDDLSVTLPVKTLSPEITPAASAFDVFLGNSPESLGGLSAALLLIGCLYLIIRGVISWQIPVGFIGGAAVIWYVFMFDGVNYDYAIYHLCSGGIVLAAVFGATEYSSSPVVPFGRLIHGVGCGVLAMIFRGLGLYTEGVLLAMLIMSLFSRVIDIVTAERYFGYRTKKLGERFGCFFPKLK